MGRSRCSHAERSGRIADETIELDNQMHSVMAPSSEVGDHGARAPLQESRHSTGKLEEKLSTQVDGRDAHGVSMSLNRDVTMTISPSVRKKV